MDLENILEKIKRLENGGNGSNMVCFIVAFDLLYFLNDTENRWTLKENITDWSKIKTYLIDFGDTVINQGAEYTFYYTVEIPFGIEFNKTAYSHHGVYFSIHTEEGLYPTQTDPNKIESF